MQPSETTVDPAVGRPVRLKDGARRFKRPEHEFRRAHLSGELKTLEFNGVLIIPPAEIERLRETFGEGGLSRDLQKAPRSSAGRMTGSMPPLAVATSEPKCGVAAVA
jgi:hypothetical protein